MNLDAGDKSDVGKSFLYMGPFVRKLPLVGHVLPLAAPANAEIRARGFNSIGRRGKELLDLCLGIGLFLPEDQGSHSVAGDSALHKDHQPVQSSDSLAAKCDAVNLKLYEVSLLWHHQNQEFKSITKARKMESTKENLCVLFRRFPNFPL